MNLEVKNGRVFCPKVKRYIQLEECQKWDVQQGRRACIHFKGIGGGFGKGAWINCGKTKEEEHG